jgi:hypothetical protein
MQKTRHDLRDLTLGCRRRRNKIERLCIYFLARVCRGAETMDGHFSALQVPRVPFAPQRNRKNCRQHATFSVLVLLIWMIQRLKLKVDKRLIKTTINFFLLSASFFIGSFSKYSPPVITKRALFKIVKTAQSASKVN